MEALTSEPLRLDSVSLIRRLVNDIYSAIGIRVSFFADTGEKLAVSEDNLSFCTVARQDPVINKRCNECSEGPWVPSFLPDM